MVATKNPSRRQAHEVLGGHRVRTMAPATRSQIMSRKLVKSMLLAPSFLAISGESFAQGVGGESGFLLTQQVDSLVQEQLVALSPISVVVVLGAGLLTSLSPCTLGVLPLTIGYIGGYNTQLPATTSVEGAEGEATEGSQQRTQPSLMLRSCAFAGGLATTLAGLGIVAASLGKAYGSIGPVVPVGVSVVAIVMGLNLLDLLPFRLPSVSIDTKKLELPPIPAAYLAGLVFAFAASPCSTPVLATLLAYTTQTQDPVAGGGLLLAYSLGYVGPLMAAATMTGALQNVMKLSMYSRWVTPTSGMLLVGGGAYALVTRAIPSF